MRFRKGQNTMDSGSRFSLFSREEGADSVRRVLVRGIFWRILVIEGILLVWSLAYSFVTGQHDSWNALLWYAVRILILIGIIVAFVVVTFRSFLTQKIIRPLEAIVEANRRIQEGDPSAKAVRLPEGTPREIQDISSTRAHMLEEIFKVSEERLRLVNFIRETFGRYLSQKVVDAILESPEGRKIGGRRQQVTILMSDLRGFAGLSETRDPEGMVQLLNRYFGKMSEVILEHDGMIDEFIGDSILAIFGIPESRPDDALRAVACAIAMQNALNLLNAQIVQEGYPPLEMGVGINTGSVIVGNIGSERRMKYGIVGAAVNVAARIESHTTGGQVLIGESTYREVRNRICAEEAQTVMMKGFRKPLVYFPVSSVGEPFQVKLKTQKIDREGVEIALPFSLYPMDGKRILDDPIQGETRIIGENSLTVEVPTDLDVMSNVRLKFDFCMEAHCFEDVYAKVIQVQRDSQKARFELRITAMAPSDRALLTQWIREGSP